MKHASTDEEIEVALNRASHALEECQKELATLSVLVKIKDSRAGEKE